MWSSKQQMENASIEANIVDGSLVIALMNADTPKVWRTTQFAKASFEVVDKDDKYMLVMVVDNTRENIADFNDKADAVHALRVVMAAMTGGAVVASKRIKPPLAAERKESAKEHGVHAHGFFFYLKKFLKFVFWIVLLAAVGLFLVALFLPAPEGGVGQQGTPTIEKGTPMPAKQLFGD